MQKLQFLVALLLVCMAGLSHADQKVDQEAVNSYRQAASQGNAAAQCLLGAAYHEGQGVPKNYQEAVNWNQKAADQGNASAQYFLGVAYDQGLGVPQNYPEAASWYQKASDQGNASAQYYLGLLYALGQGVPQNKVLAYMLLSLAATGGDKDSVLGRDTVQNEMTPDEIAKGQELAAKWKPGTPLPTSY